MLVLRLACLGLLLLFAAACSGGAPLWVRPAAIACGTLARPP